MMRDILRGKKSLYGDGHEGETALLVFMGSVTEYCA